MATRIQLRRGTKEQWETVNPILAIGEPGWETDTGILRIGDGITPYTDLTPIFTLGAIEEYLENSLVKISNAEQRVINSLSTYGSGYPRFSVNSALVDDYGEPIFLTYSDTSSVLTAQAPIVYTTASGLTRTVDEDIVKDCSSFSNGSYNVFIDFEDESNNFILILLSNAIYEQKAKPTSPQANDIWLNTAVYPNVSYIYQDEEWVETSCVLIGNITIEKSDIESTVQTSDSSVSFSDE